MHNASTRIYAALPDTITALTFLIAWLAPQWLGPEWVRLLLVAVVVEFLVMHASALYGFGARRPGDWIARRAMWLLVLSGLYLLVVGAICVAIGSWTPAVSFLWLFSARFAFVLLNPANAAAESQRMQQLWFVSLATYFVGLIATSKLPLPALGLTPDFVASLSVSGAPRPNTHPELTIAFGFFYFIVQAGAKAFFADATPAPDTVRTPATPPGSMS